MKKENKGSLVLLTADDGKALKFVTTDAEGNESVTYGVSVATHPSIADKWQEVRMQEYLDYQEAERKRMEAEMPPVDGGE